ncbi:MAG: 30S ribosomal protein S18 [Candidatus Melainabacteria bacterium]|nr:30S ribosomal protein S18 [Candidatus Melainabacteria bacterium]
MRSARNDGLRRKKMDPLVAGKIEYVDYKDVATLRKFVSDSGKILPARITGLTRSNQRMITRAIKRARAIGLLPFNYFHNP